MKTADYVRRNRIRVAISIFYLFAAAFMVYVALKNPIENNVYGFFLHDERYFHCPSCGATRAFYCLLKFDFKSAFYYHAFFTVFSPVLAYVAVCLTVNLWCGKKIIPYPGHYSAYLYALLGLWMIFTVIRNFTDVVY